jgi:AraC-like DNA-binding protein
VEDFQICSFLWVHARLWPVEVAEDIDVWFMHDEPTSREEYTLTLGKARVHFLAPFTGFSFDARHLKSALPSSDSRLHHVIRMHADVLLADLPERKTMAMRVREVLLKHMANGELESKIVAKRLHMSTRTLVRRLSVENTTFTSVLDDVRRDLALRHVAKGDMGFVDIALLTGFSDVPSFYRAFRRWTGMTPLEYRRRGGIG